ncbi:anthranilate phosphoribosyltransferase [archaeon 13_1_40CM_2_52_13]|nr:MAG: anthranilate phosphoribosyltransferase [archaeon 13_1_40CM_2_52_13]TMI41365.1 MAG: anthranilate phosphoribosyltransferase [Candidatus Bathyarchaeota archaeon]
MIREYIPVLLENHNLTREQAEAAMMEIMNGQATPSQISAFLIGLKKKGETVDEITAIARVMRTFSRTVSPRVDGYLLDTCGTGGDRTKTFNVSTTAAFVIAAAGVRVAKHGNRSFTSHCGSADVLEQLGVKLEIEPALVEKAIEEIGIGFMFAPNFHPAMKNVASIRREIGVRTVFNILGPLTNPAGTNAQLIGVYESELLEPMCVAAHNLGARSVMTVYGLDGIDEISLTGKTLIVKQQNGKTVREEIVPEDLGLTKTTPEMLAGGDPEQNAQITARILSGHLGRDDPRVQIVAANAAAGLVLCEATEDMKTGVELALNAVENGKALRILRKLIELSGGNPERLEIMA